VEEVEGVASSKAMTTASSVAGASSKAITMASSVADGVSSNAITSVSLVALFNLFNSSSRSFSQSLSSSVTNRESLLETQLRVYREAQQRSLEQLQERNVMLWQKRH
jgi:hypothetical protein